MGQRVLLVDLVVGCLTVVVSDDAVDGGGGAVGFTKGDGLRDAVLSAASTFSNGRLDTCVVRLSELLHVLCISNTVAETHLIETFEIAFWVSWLALLVHLPGGGDNPRILLISPVGLAKSEAVGGQVPGRRLGPTHVVLH